MLYAVCFVCVKYYANTARVFLSRLLPLQHITRHLHLRLPVAPPQGAAVLGTMALLRALDLLRLLHPPLLHVHAIRHTVAVRSVVEPKPI